MSYRGTIIVVGVSMFVAGFAAGFGSLIAILNRKIDEDKKPEEPKKDDISKVVYPKFQ